MVVVVEDGGEERGVGLGAGTRGGDRRGWREMGRSTTPQPHRFCGQVERRPSTEREARGSFPAVLG